MERVTVDQASAMIRDNLRGMRAEYTRMRDIAQKRIKRLGESEFAYTHAYTEHPNGFPKLKDISPRNFAKAFSELSKFVNAKASSVTGQREIMMKTINTWNEQGIPLSKETYQRTMQILEQMRRMKIMYDSDTAEDLARTTLVLSDQQFGKVLDNLETFLLHHDSVSDYMDAHYDAQSGYQMIDMDDFLNEIG